MKRKNSIYKKIRFSREVAILTSPDNNLWR
nr:MAG TPA: hypothetical protein [Caudoviricetes sp.]